MKYDLLVFNVAWVLADWLVMLVTAQMSKQVFDTSFKYLLRRFRPAIFSSVMAICVMFVKSF